MKNGKVVYIKSPVFDSVKGFVHGFLTRHHGESSYPFNSLNISFEVGDDKDLVSSNRKLVLDEFGFDKLVDVKQVHGSKIYIPGPLEGNYGVAGESFVEADIIISDNPGQLLMIKTADCQPVIIVDPVQKVVAAIHSGWRGSIGNVICVAISEMTEKYGSNPLDMLASIGPSLGPCCAEFVNYRKEIPEEYWKYRVGKYHFDFWALSRYQLESAGLNPQNIWIEGVCTKCDYNNFFSYRRENITGRQGTVAGFKF